jgi:hypothetical protein
MPIEQIERSKIGQQIYEDAVKSNVETIYFNGFTTALGNGDITVVLQKNGKPIALLNASYTVAKTLSIKLGELVSFLEDKTNQKMLTTDQVQECVSGEKKNGNGSTESR